MISVETLEKLHDALIVSIKFEGGILTIAGTYGTESWNITASDVKYVVGSPFLAGNIVSKVLIHRFDAVCRNTLSVSSDLSDMFFDVYGVSEVSSSFSDSYFLEISASYGLEVLCLFDGDIECDIL